MADEKTEDSGTSSTPTCPLQQKEDYAPSQHNEDDATSLYQSTSPGSFPNVGAQHATKFSGPAQNMPGFGGHMDAGIAMINSNTGFLGQQIPTYQNIPVQTGEGTLFCGSEGHQLADQVISGSRGRGREREPSLKRPATQSPSTRAHPAQRRNTIRPSSPASAPAAPSIAHPTQIAPVPPQSQIAALFGSMPQTVDFCLTLSQPRGPLRISQDQVIPSSTGSGLDQASDASIGSSLERSVTEPPPIFARRFQHRPAIHPSDSASAQTAPSVAYPTQTALVRLQARNLSWPLDHFQAQTAAFRPFVPETVDYLQHLSKTPAFPLSNSANETPPPLHMSTDLDRAARSNPQRQSRMCGLCGYDLSSTPQGLLISTLSCGHRCHIECLQFFPLNSACLACNQSYIDSYISSRGKGI